jgi:hypothetical protein
MWKERNSDSINARYQELDRLVGALNVHLSEDSIVKILTGGSPLRTIMLKGFFEDILKAPLVKRPYSHPNGQLAQHSRIGNLHVIDGLMGITEIYGAYYGVYTVNSGAKFTKSEDMSIPTTPIYSYPEAIYDNDPRLLFKAALFKDFDHFKSLSTIDTALLVTHGTIQPVRSGTTAIAARGINQELYIMQSYKVDGNNFTQTSHWKPIVYTDKGVLVAKIPATHEDIYQLLSTSEHIEFEM